jgi:hypothetical protein
MLPFCPSLHVVVRAEAGGGVVAVVGTAFDGVERAVGSVDPQAAAMHSSSRRRGFRIAGP